MMSEVAGKRQFRVPIVFLAPFTSRCSSHLVKPTIELMDPSATPVAKGVLTAGTKSRSGLYLGPVGRT
jgi:hypothetical protein